MAAPRSCTTIDLALRDGEFMTVLGPSGSGKTTILRLIGGFVAPTRGAILLDGDRHLADADQPAAVQHRLPGLRPLPAHDGRGECRLRPQGARRAARRRSAGASPIRSTLVALDGFGAALSGAAQRRPAAARRARPRHHLRAAADPPRRAARRARRRAAPADAALPQAACSARSAPPSSSSPTTRRRRSPWPTASA